MPDDFNARALTVLRQFADGTARDPKTSDPDLSAILEWLHDQGFISGKKYTYISGESPSFINLRITQKGLMHIEQATQKLVERNSHERAYSAKYPIRAQIIAAVLGAAITTAGLVLFNWLIGR